MDIIKVHFMDIIACFLKYFSYNTLFNLGKAIAVFFGFILFRKLFTKWILKLVRKFTSKTKSTLDDQLVDAFEKPLQMLFIILGIYFASKFIDLSAPQVLFMQKLLRSSIIILLTWGLYNLEGFHIAFWNGLNRRLNISTDNILIPFLTKVMRVITIVLGITIVADEWYDITGLITGLGLGGLAFALAAQDTVANIFGGIVIILDRPFNIGDWIYTGSVEGVVEDITFRSTKVRTFSQALVTVPNSTLANEPITNWSRMGKRRIRFHIGVTYSTTSKQLKTCIEKIQNMLENHPSVHKETIVVKFDEFAASSMDILLHFFTITTDWTEYVKIKEDINFKIMEILETENVSMAFPSRSIYIENEEKEDQ